MQIPDYSGPGTTTKCLLPLVIALSLPAASSVVGAQTLGERMDKHLTDLHSDGRFSGSVSVTKGDEVLLAKGYGLADAEHNVTNSPETRFRIGSITKQFTAMAILTLQDQGKLSVTDPLREHITDIPERWEAITIHQLLTHTSGIMHSWALPSFRETMMVPASLTEVLARFHQEPLVFQPGEGFQYSGVGYFVLAHLIEVVSGRPYGAFLHETILAPLGMLSTGADDPEIVIERRARGYVTDDGTLCNAPTIYMPILTGGGNLYSTVEDLAQWDRALRERRLISAAGYEALYRPEKNGYAYGWGVSELEGRTSLAHTGGVPGFTSFIGRLPSEELCVVVLCNLLPCDAGGIGGELVERALGAK